MEQASDWYAFLDRLSDEEIQEELSGYDKKELVNFSINLIRSWAFNQKQNEIKNEQFYRELVRMLQ